MSDRIKKIKVKKADGSMTDYIPIGVDAENVDFDNGYKLDNIVGSINPDESGSIAAQLSKSIKYYDCVADMKADTTLNEERAARTLGYYEPGDGGTAFYKIINNSNGYEQRDLDNECFIISLSNNLYAVLILNNNSFNTAQVGLEDSKKTEDCSEKLQYLFDYSYNNDLDLLFNKNITYNVKKPIILKEYNSTENKRYNISTTSSFNTKSSIPNIFIKADIQTEYLFVGEKYPSNFTKVRMYMNNICITSSAQVEVTFFKGIEFYSCNINNCMFYFPQLFLEGCFSTGSRFYNNRIQGFTLAIMTDVCSIGHFDLETIRDELMEKNNDYSQMTSIIPRRTQNNDELWFENNYIAGSTSITDHETYLFITGSFDRDFYIRNNWFEFFTFAIGYLYKSESQNKGPTYGTIFYNNMFQVFYRFFEQGGFYYDWVLDSNTFTSYDIEEVYNRGTKAIEKYRGTKAGIMIYDTQNDIVGTRFQGIRLTNNKLFTRDATTDYFIYIDFGNSSAYNLRLYTDGNHAGLYSIDTITNYIYLRYPVTAGNEFSLVEIRELNNTYLTELPPIVENTKYVLNSFAGRIINVNGDLYIAKFNGTTPEYHQF